MNTPNNFRRYLPYALILLAYLAGMFVDIMEIDAAQYATMARDMLRNGDFLQLHDRGRDYLDKPPLTFWMSMLSFKIFGYSTWAYKLPSVIFSLIAVWGTEKLCSELYNLRTAHFAGLILASSQAFFLMNNDVKTDMYLIAPLMVATWLLVKASRGGNWLHVVFAGLALGVGMLAKGPIVVIAAGMALAGDLALRRDWQQFLKWKWLLIVPTIFLVTLPFDIGLYRQFGWRGVEFFYWTQSFGRVTGESEWVNDATAFFFVHTFAWSFLPWTLLFLGALFYRFKKIIQAGFIIPTAAEAVSLSGFTLVFLALSFSRFKLPHYIFITYPFAAIMCAGFLMEMQELQLLQKWKQFFLRAYQVIWVIAFSFATFLMLFAFPEASIWPKIAFILLGLLLTVDALRTKDEWVRFVWPTVLGFALSNLAFNISIYPEIMDYQTTSLAGKLIQKEAVAGEIYAFNKSGRALDFYGGAVAKPINIIEEVKDLVQNREILLYTDEPGFQTLVESQIKHEVLFKHLHNPPNHLSITFMNPATRDASLGQRYLLRIPRQ